MRHKVSELDGALLDAAVAMAEGINVLGFAPAGRMGSDDGPYWVDCHPGDEDVYTPHMRPYHGTQKPMFRRDVAVDHQFTHSYIDDWDRCGPIIERELIGLTFGPLGVGEWMADTILSQEMGPTPLIAAMRAYVASKLGDEIELPDVGLLEG